MRNDVPVILSNLAPIMTYELNNNDWLNEMAKITAMELTSAAAMNEMLNNNRTIADLIEIIMAFRWLFHTEYCGNPAEESFGDHVKQSNVIEKGMNANRYNSHIYYYSL